MITCKPLWRSLYPSVMLSSLQGVHHGSTHRSSNKAQQFHTLYEVFHIRFARCQGGPASCVFGMVGGMIGLIVHSILGATL